MALGPRRIPIPSVAVACQGDGALRAADVAVDDQGVALRRRLAGGHDDRALAATLLERISAKHLRNEPAVGQFRNASGRVAVKAPGQRLVVRLPLVANGSEPFTHRKSIAA